MQCQAKKTAGYLLVLSFLLNSNKSWADDWKLEKHKDTVSIYSKKTDTGYKKVLVKTIVKAKPHALIALLGDVAFAPQWMFNCIEVKILDEISPKERLINSFFAAPWPVKDRDMVFYSKTTSSHNTVQIEISDRGDTTPHHSKYVRMQEMHGMWEASLLENGRSVITYTGSGNPGGKLPTFVANKELINTMFKTFQNLNKVIVLEKYQPSVITD
jgi:hypothetical protein